MIFVTGGTGMIGARLLFDLTSDGTKVRALRRTTAGMEVLDRIFLEDPLRKKNIEWVTGDVTDIFSIEEAMNGADTVYHSAAFISFNSSDNKKMMKTNVEGTANVVNFALKYGVKRFCHISSVAAMGRVAGQNSITEESTWKISSENSNYAISKYGGEREVWRAMEEGLPAVIVSPSIVIGPGNWNSGSAQMFSSVWKGLRFYATGSTGFVDFRDVSKAARLLMKNGVSGERFIVTSENLAYRKVFDTIAAELGKPLSSVKVTPLLGGIGWRAESIRSLVTGKKSMITRETVRNGSMHWNYSNKKIRERFGMEFIPVAQSIRHTAEVFKVENSRFKVESSEF